MKENREVTDTNVEDIEEAFEKLSTGKKIKMYELLRTFKKEGIENFVTTRKKYVDVILSDYKRVLKENEELKSQEETARKVNELLVERYSTSIPVQIVKDKIEEIKQEKKKYGNCLIEMYEDELVNRDIKILQEIIEGRKENESN